MNKNTNNTAATTAIVFKDLPVRPCRFDRLRPGSIFRIVAEPERGIRVSKDQRVWRKAHKDDGFFSTLVGNNDVAAVLLPNDVVQPVKAERIG